MNKTLHILVDSSGSMLEMAKISIIMNLLSFIREYQLIHSSHAEFTNIKILKWNHTIEVLEFIDDKELLPFEAVGKLDFEILRERLEHEINIGHPLKVLLLSDGNYQDSDVKNFMQWKKENSNIFFVPIVVGADFLDTYLAKLSYNGGVYNPEDISAAMQSLTLTLEEKIERPYSIKDILDNSDKQEVDDWE